jgi:hypothetical protein
LRALADRGGGGCGPERRFTLLGRRLPETMVLRFVVLEAGSERPYRPAEWQGALVVVEHGAITLVTVDRERRQLPCGAVLWLCELPLRAIANPHIDPAVISVLSRRGAGDRAPG